MFRALKKVLGFRKEASAAVTQQRDVEIKPVNILHIDSSILGDHSVSRLLSAEILSRQLALHPGANVVHLDLASKPSLHLSRAHLAAFQGGPVSDADLGADLAASGNFIEDLFAADVIVIGAPMYNFTIPSQLKAWIDRIVVAGRTFRYSEAGPEGLVIGKKVFIASARGGIYSDGAPASVLDHQEAYLRSVLAFIGLTDLTIIRAEGLNLGEEIKVKAIADAQAQIAALAL